MRFRLRFSVRTLAIFLTLLCVYFGAWEATKNWGIKNESESSPAPLIIKEVEAVAVPTVNGDLTAVIRTRYTLCVFASRIELSTSYVKPGHVP